MNRLGDAPTDLLFSLIALHNDLLAPAVIPAALRAQADDPDRSLGDHLVAQGALSAAQRDLVKSLVSEHIQRHGGDTKSTLATLIDSPSARERLEDPTITDAFDPTVTALSTVADGRGTERANTVRSSVAGPRFRVLRRHARGGLGEVFVALDSELNREVALKQMQDRYADDPVSRQRFLVEAEVTGGLEHPGIVPVYGLGTYAGGRPYYAMRFVNGDSLKEAIARFHAPAVRDGRVHSTELSTMLASTATPGQDDEQFHSGLRARELELDLRRLLRRFLDVCNTIEYAHSRGVLHRDIKPANVIVGKYGETLVVDWGLAKSLGRVEPGQEGIEHILVVSSTSGSAETLPGSALGTPAYMSPEQARGELDRLGTRSDVYSLGATLYCLLTGRPPFDGEEMGEVLAKVKRGEFAAPRSLEPSLDPALDAICKKAMAFEPEERYATCRLLADDVERWMADEAVTAWREPLARRARRWSRRNRTAVIALAASVLVALAGTAVVLAMQTQANANLRSANLDLALANSRVVAANADLKLANAREKERFDLALQAIQLFHGEVSEDLLLKEKQFEGLRAKLLKGAADFYGRLEEMLKGKTDRESRAALGKAYDELAELTGKIGDQSAALGIYGKALAVRRALAAEPGASSDRKLDVARSLISAGGLRRMTGDMSGALSSYTEARSLAEEAQKRGGVAELAQRVLGAAYNQTGYLLTYKGDTAGARPIYAKALTIWQKLADANPGVTQFQQSLATCHNLMGFLLSQTGDTAGARAANARGLAIRQKLADDHPGVTRFQIDLAWSHYNIGTILSELGEAKEARAAHLQGLAIRQKLARANPTVTPIQAELADSLLCVGWLLMETGRPAEAVEFFSREQSIRQRLVDANPTVPEYRNSLANCQTNAAAVLLRLGKTSQARACCEQAIDLRSVLTSENASLPQHRSSLAETLLRFGQVRQAELDFVGAAADWKRAIASLQKVPRLDGELVFIHAGCHALLSTSAGIAGTEVSADQKDTEAVRAMALLRQAAGIGFRAPYAYRNETALDPLRDRPDFQELLMDLDFPVEPFTE